MTTHKFKQGEFVNLRQARVTNVPRGPYEVLGLLPAEDGVPIYRIKNHDESHERVAREIELTRHSGFASLDRGA